MERMISEYQNLIFSICFHIVKDHFEAEDLTQETFLSAYRSFSTFDGQNEKAWLTRIATNKCLDYLKQAARRQIPMEDTYFSEVKDTSPLPEKKLLEEEVRQDLYERCKNLKPPYDEIALEHFYEEKTAAEIAGKHRKKLKTIQTQIYRARELLRPFYRKEDTG